MSPRKPGDLLSHRHGTDFLHGDLRRGQPILPASDIANALNELLDILESSSGQPLEMPGFMPGGRLPKGASLGQLQALLQFLRTRGSGEEGRRR
jgi:hypothetical protein